jgi:hypothetical protein
MTVTFGLVAPASSTEIRTPSGSAPQYDTFTPALPRKSIVSQVAGNVAIKKKITLKINDLIMLTPPEGCPAAANIFLCTAHPERDLGGVGVLAARRRSSFQVSFS